MSWIILLIAGLLEVVWAVGLKYNPRFFSSDPQYYHYYCHDYQYGVTFLGNENATCWNGVRYLDRHRRRRGGNHRYPSAGRVCLTGAFAQSWLDRRGYNWAKTQHALIRR